MLVSLERLDQTLEDALGGRLPNIREANESAEEILLEISQRTVELAGLRERRANRHI